MASSFNIQSEFDTCSVQLYNEVYNREGFNGLKPVINTDISAWKNKVVRIAITGQSGTGKSSLVNALRSIDGDDPEAAPVGVNETTIEINEYRHPSNPNFIFVDLPGADTSEFPRETYLEKIGVNTYEFFIITSNKRFTDCDKWLANEIVNRNKQFIFIRTHIESDVRNARRVSKKSGTPFSEKELLESIRKDCQHQLVNCTQNVDIFLIDNHCHFKYDFPSLKKKLIDSTDDIVKEVIVMSFDAKTKEVLDAKIVVLQKKIWKVSLLAAIAPRLGDKDIGVLLDEKTLYKQQFQLESTTTLDDTENLRFQLSEEFDNFSDADEFSEIKELIPFIALFYNQVKTYTIGKKWLNETLTTMHRRAVEKHVISKPT